MEEYTYGITRRGIRPYGHLAQYRGWPETREQHQYWAWRQTAPPSLTAGGAWRIPPGSQDNVRVDRPEHKALFAYQKRLEAPDPFDGSERGQERCLKRQELQLDWVQQLKGAPLKSSQDDREVPRRHKGWPGVIHPPGPLQEPHDEIMLSQAPAVHCIMVSLDSGYIHFQGEGDSLRSNLSCRKEGTTPIVHLRGSSRREEHQFRNRLHFSA